MQIKRNSWHYKLNTFGSASNHSLPKSFCSYFWHTVWRLILWSGLIGFLTLGSFVAGLPAVEYLAGAFGLVFGKVTFGFLSVVIGAVSMSAFIGATVGLAVGSAYTWAKIDNYREDKRYEEEKFRIENNLPEPEPSLFKQFVKVKNEKFCPMLEFVDEK